MKMDRPEKSLDSGEKTEQPGRGPNVRTQGSFYLSLLWVVLLHQLREAVDFPHQEVSAFPCQMAVPGRRLLLRLLLLLRAGWELTKQWAAVTT